MSERYDVIVIGAGPAGYSAAITLKQRNRSVLVVGSVPVSEKVSKAHIINNYPGLPEIPGAELAERLQGHAARVGVEFLENRIVTVYSMGKYFSLQTSNNEMLEASAVILAFGVNFEKPLPGEETYLGRGVSYCATCDAMFYRGLKTVVVGSSPKEEAEAAFLAEVAGEVIYVPLYESDTDLPAGVRVIRDRPVEIRGGFKADTLVLETQEIKADGIFLLRQSVPPAQLVPGLQLDGNHILVNRRMETNLPGCFACGDITGTPYQYIKAAGEGNVAALSAIDYINKIR